MFIELLNGFIEQGMCELIQIISKIVTLIFDGVAVEYLFASHGLQQQQKLVVPVVQRDVFNHLGKGFGVVNPVEQLEFILKVIVEGLAVQAAGFGDVGDGDFMERLGAAKLLERAGNRLFGNQRIGHSVTVSILRFGVGQSTICFIIIQKLHERFKSSS